MSKKPAPKKNLSIAVPPPFVRVQSARGTAGEGLGEMRTPSSALASVMNRALGLRGPDAGLGSPINKATTRQSSLPRSRSERESGHEHRSPPYLPVTSRHAPAPDAAAGEPGRAQSATRTRPPVFERMLTNTREPPPTPMSCKPHQTRGGTRDPYRSHEATDTERRVRLTEASSGKATAAATLRREDGTCEAGAKGLLEHEELMKLRQENQDLRAQLRRERRGHLTERPRTAGGDRGSGRGNEDEDLGDGRGNKDGRVSHVDRSRDRSRDCSSKIRMERLPSANVEPVDGFEVLGRRYKEVWGTRSHSEPGRLPKRTRAVDGDRGGKFFDDCDFQSCEEPNTSGAAAPRPTHAYFTRTASAEMLAQMDGMGI
jgi:hypothetical protein